MVKSRGQYCGDIELVGYLANASDPVPWVMDPRVSHDRVDSSPDPVVMDIYITLTIWISPLIFILTDSSGN